MIKLRVYGIPVPQGSTRAFAVRKGGTPTGRVVVTGDNAKTKSWRQAVLEEARTTIVAAGWTETPPFASQPLSVKLIFILPRPAGHFGTGKNAGQVKGSAPYVPVTKPDLDKLCRAVLDALTDACMWRDDAQVAVLSAGKTYGDKPGCEIEVGLLREAGYGG